MIREPFYQLEIKTANCYIEILVNDLPIFSNYQEGGMAVDYPINNALLTSGEQSLEVRILPSEGSEKISRYADHEVNVYVKEANREASGRQLVFAVPKNTDYKEQSLLVSKQNAIFPAEIPYHNTGWKDSVDLRLFDQEILFQELKSELSKMTAIYNSKNIADYRSMYKDRIREHNKSFYLTKEEIEENDASTFSGLPAKLKSVDPRTYKMVFFGNGKLVSLQTKMQPPGFVFESVDENEYGFTEMVLFHKKTPNSPLEIIR